MYSALRGWVVSSIMKSDKRNFENKGRSAKGNDKNKAGEKTFDKKKYRLQKYSNKYKGIHI